MVVMRRLIVSRMVVVVMLMVGIGVQMMVVRLLVIGGWRRLVVGRCGCRVAGATSGHHHAAHHSRRSPEGGRLLVEQGGRRAVAWTGTAVLASAGFGGQRRQRSRSARTVSVDGRFQVVVIVHHHQIAGSSALFGTGRRSAVRLRNSAVRRVDQAAAGQIVVAIATVASVTTALVVGSAQSTATRQGLVLAG